MLWSELRACFFIIFRKSYSTQFMKRMRVSPSSSLTAACNNAAQYSQVKILPEPVKSINDKKTYKVIQLENGLTACLVCDYPCPSSTDKSDDSASREKVESEDSIDSPRAPKARSGSMQNVIPSDEDKSSEHSESGSSSGNEASEESEAEDIEDHPHEDFTDEKAKKKDPDSSPKLAAAALTVAVGTFSDPKDIPGMAHFVEHMVFMGSEKYPKENAFDSFIKKKGGSNNAATDSETTTFYFECLEKDLPKALDMFSQFFISPLMKRSSMKREREAIESEFQMALPSDTFRKEQLLCTFADEESPVNSFGWGNLITLQQNVKADYLYEKAHEFRKRHYSAHRMTLAIQARLPLSTIENHVLRCFSNVPSNGLPPLDFEQYSENVFKTPHFNKIYYVSPVKDVNQVDLTWALPSLLDKYESKPQDYLSWFLGHEGKGSLLSHLKRKFWALGIDTGNSESGTEHNIMYTFFMISIILTKDGQDHIDQVIESVFSYIQLLKNVGPQESIFREMQLIDETEFRFATEESAADTVEHLSESMHYFPSKHYLAGSELRFEYDPDAINMVMSYLTPENVNIMILSNNPPEGKTFSKTEKWFGTQYIDTDIPAEWMEMWKSVAPCEDYKLPVPNPFLTQNFDILPPLDSNPDYPQKLVGTPLMELWYRKDDRFNLPTAFIYINIISPYVMESPLKYCMLDVMVVLLNLNLIEDIYPAQQAGLSHTIYCSDRGISIKVSGYNEKLPILLEHIANELTNTKPKINENIFGAVKEKMIKFYHNKTLKPSVLATEVRLKLILKKYFSHLDKGEAICDLTFPKMLEFFNQFFERLYIKILIQGNISKSTAKEVGLKFVTRLEAKPLEENTYPRFEVIELPMGEYCCRVKSFNKRDANSIVTNYYQTGPADMQNIVQTELLEMLIEEPLFDTLRTKEQLGYNVYYTLRITFGIVGHSLSVNAQATKFTTEYVDSRIETFIKFASNMLKTIPDAKFNKIKRNLIRMKLLTDVTLEEEVNRNWSEIVSDEYVFDRLKQEIQTLREVTSKDIKRIWEDHHSSTGSSFRKLSIQVVGYDTSEDMEVEDSIVTESEECTFNNIEFLDNAPAGKSQKKSTLSFVKDFQEFKENLSVYPLTPLTNKS